MSFSQSRAPHTKWTERRGPDNRFRTRIVEHAQRGWEKIEPIAVEAQRNVAKGAEQHLIENLKNLENKINSIAVNNPIYGPSTDKGRSLLDGLGWLERLGK